MTSLIPPTIRGLACFACSANRACLSFAHTRYDAKRSDTADILQSEALGCLMTSWVNAATNANRMPKMPPIRAIQSSLTAVMYWRRDGFGILASLTLSGDTTFPQRCQHGQQLSC